MLQMAKDLVKRVLPDILVFQISPIIIRYYSTLMTWLVTSRKYDAEISPMSLIWINPSRIKTKMPEDGSSPFNHSNVISEVVAGDWDQQSVPLEEYHLYRSFFDRFENELDWEETELYQECERKFEQGHTEWGCENMDDFEDRLDELDSLVKNIRTNGYRTQKELRRLERDTTALRDIHRYWPPELHEITVNIDRDGRFILHDGRHRLTIAHVLGLDRIPVRVKARHLIWQKKRDRVAGSNEEINLDHPDIPT